MLSSEEPTDISSIQQFPEKAGNVLIKTLPTTCAFFCNEFQSSLIGNLKALIARLAPERNGTAHVDPHYSDCERGNVHSHLRAGLPGCSVAVGINEGELSLGRFHSLIFAEIDGDGLVWALSCPTARPRG